MPVQTSIPCAKSAMRLSRWKIFNASAATTGPRIEVANEHPIKAASPESAEDTE